MSKKPKAQAEFVRWMGPLLDCLRALGGSAKPKEVSGWIARQLKLPSTVTESALKSGASRFHNQVQWARQYLVWQGLIDDSKRGIWTLTPLGWKTRLDEPAACRVFLDRVKINRRCVARMKPPPHRCRRMTPDRTQPNRRQPTKSRSRICWTSSSRCRRTGSNSCAAVCCASTVSRRSRSRNARVMAASTAMALLRLSPFVSLRVAFQAKRFADTVARRDIGEFRNALLGRAEKGVFITTGRFTADAATEAARDGVIPIELIDGERLVELFQTAELGVRPRQTFAIDHAFFDEFRRA